MTTSLRLLDAIRASMFQVNEDDAYPLICNLHELGKADDSHNCVACNLADLVNSINELAMDFDNFTNKTTAEITYLIWLYLLTERMDEIFKLISFPEEMRVLKFPTHLLTKRWGNFVKHPKAFLLTHHARFDSENVGENEIVIDSDFVDKFYSGSKKNGELYKTLTNNSNVVVRLPNLVDLTRGLGCELRILSDIILSNPIYAEIMTNKSVLENYFSNPHIDQSGSIKNDVPS